MTMFLAPYTAIADIDGSPLDAGFLFLGEYGKDPELFPIEVFWDADFTVPAAQPIRTRNGYPVRNGSPTKVYLKTAQHSIVIKNRNSAFILVDFKNKGWGASFIVDSSGKNQQQINDIQLKGIPLITYFGAIADGIFRKIKDVDPSITLAEVQSVGGASATLDSSHDWFIAQRLANQNKHFRIGDESQLVVDRPLIILHSFYTIYARPGQYAIKNIGVGTSAVVIGGVVLAQGVRVCGGVRGVHWGAGRSGHGVEIAYGSRTNLSGMALYENGGSGIHSGPNQHCWGLKADGIRATNNAINGVDLEHRSAFQKNAISITNSEINGNGINQVNGKPYFHDKIVTYDHGHGIKISGTGYNLTGSTVEGNSGAGVYAGGPNAQHIMRGLNLTGCYLEPNLLADIYLDNSVADFEDVVIKGNYRGAIRVAHKAEKGHIFAVRPRLILNSDIQDLFIGESAKYSKDVRIATSLFIGGEMQTNNMFDTVADVFAKTGSNVVKLTSSNNNLQSQMNYIDSRVLFNASSYVFDLEYLWERAGLTSSSTVTLGFTAADYDDRLINTYTTPEYKAVGTNYATVQTDVAASSTGATITVGSGGLAGWDTATFNFLNIYNTVLSNGVAVGTEYTHNVKPSNTVSISAGSNTITLTGTVPEIKAGTKIGLGDSSGGAFIWRGYPVYEDESLQRKKWSVNLSGISYAKWIKDFQVYLTLNNAVVGESLNIRRIRIRELPSLLMNGTTAQRPVLTTDQRSFKYYDNTINKEVTWSGTQWLTAMYLEYNQMNAVAELATGADLATAVLKVNALLSELKAKGLMKSS